MARITKIPVGAKEQGGKIYDIVTPCRGCRHCNHVQTDGLARCVYRIEGFAPERVIICGDKWTNIQKR